jgi:4-phytase / acid phosphatase
MIGQYTGEFRMLPQRTWARVGLAAVLTVLCNLSGTVSPAAADDLRLEKFIVLMRHGVRPPTSTNEITPLAADPWPGWEVPDGMLTHHGALAAARLGAWEGRMLAAAGLLQAPTCPKDDEVFAWASGALQRTVDTGNAVLAGMFPGCGLTVGHNATSGSDPLFVASETDVGHLDLDKARAAVLAAMGGSLESAQQKLAPLMADLQPILRCCSAAVCEAADMPQGCTFGDRPWTIRTANGGRNLALGGPIGQGSTIVQVFLLEYTAGLPSDQIAWGRASTAQDVIHLSAIRKAKYDYFERVPYIARRGASNLFNQLLIAIAQGADLPGTDRSGGPPPAKLVLFIGSDTQIAEIGGMLGAHWHLRSYLDDETPPTGGLTFALLVNQSTGHRYVRMKFLTPTLDQIRAAAVLDDANAPEDVNISIPGCDQPGADEVCPVERFIDIARHSLDPTATAPQHYR